MAKMATSFHSFHLPTMPTLPDFIPYNGPHAPKPPKKLSPRRAREPASPAGPWADIDEIEISHPPGNTISSPTTDSARSGNQESDQPRHEDGIASNLEERNKNFNRLSSSQGGSRGK